MLTRNRPDYLPHAIRSAGTQTHPELELVLVRDGGDPLDAASRLAVEALEFPAVLVEREGPAEGVARSRNEAIASSRADAVAFLERDPRVDVAYADARIRREDTGAERVIARDFDLAVLSRDDYIPPSAML